MFTTVGFYESITNGASLVEVNGVLDQSMTTDAANRFQAPGAWTIFAAHLMGVNVTRAQIFAPSFRQLQLPEIYPVLVAADVPTLDGPVIYGPRGLSLVPAESFILNVSRGGADAQPVMGALWLGPGMTPATMGKTYSVYATATPTIVAGSWVLAPLTFDQQLPAGKYEVVGMAVVCNDCSYARLVFPGNYQYRPGVVVQDTYGDKPYSDAFRMGKFGKWGEFVHNAPPQVEFLGDTAGAESAIVILDLVKIG